MEKNSLNLLLTYGLPFFLIFLMTLFIAKSGKARQEEATTAFKKEMSIHEENNRILKEILKTLKRFERVNRPGGKTT